MKQITNILGFEDEIVTGMCVNYIKSYADEPTKLDPRLM